MIIPGFIIAWLTFPGVIVHEFGHYVFCRLRRIPVFDACFFRFGNPTGYVIHGATRDFLSTFLVCVGPLIVNTLLCLVICLPAYIPFKVFGQRATSESGLSLSGMLNYVVLWLGVSVGMHAFPSTHDAMNLWRASRVSAKEGNVLTIISLPLAGLIFVANALRFVWFDYIYGIAIGIGIPSLVL